MSLTSYRAAPPRAKVVGLWRRFGFLSGPGGGGRGVKRAWRCPVRFSGLAVTYSPTSWDAVPSARRRLTAEFGMGSGVSLALVPPNLQSARGGVPPAHTRLSFFVTDFGSMTSARGRGAFLGERVRLLPDRIKPVGRLVPVS